MRHTPVGIICVSLLATLTLCGRSHAPPIPPPPSASPSSAQSSAAAAARMAARHFLSTYMETDGRVVRHDQGGDTVSEGEGYAMLLAIAAGDRESFDRVWSWTSTHLRRADGLFSWHWQDGSVTDPQPAADSDLDVAWALALGAQRFDEATLLPSARAVASAILEHETVVVGGRRVLVAGEWARSPIVVDPSYLAPSVMRALEGVTGDARWSSLADDSVTILRALTDPSPHLPPDWATVDAEGDPHPTGGPAGGQPQYGYDAIRVPLWTGTSCAAADRTVAARMWPFLRRAEAGSLAAVYTLQGTAEQGAAGAPAFVAAAAAAGASSDGGARDMLLDRAAEADAHTPTYYGAALVALGRALLTTDLLNACSRA